MTKRLNASSSSADTTATAEPENPQSEPENLQSESVDLSNKALQRCIKAWHRNFNLASINPSDPSLNCLADDDGTVFASEQGALAFRESMPLLVGYENIRDFIACTTYAMLTKILDQDECRGLLAAAKIAMALFKAQPKPPATHA
jgi:hypothetical protein